MVIVGLGNPGPAYARTRHNVGAMLVEELASRLGVQLKRRGQIRVADAVFEGRSVVLGIPTTFMNVSGPPVAKLARKQGVRGEALVVCYDELDLPLGRVRLKDGGGTAGHRGLESICASLRSRDFLRLRVGIGRPEVGVDPRDHVLDRFSPEEREAIEAAIDRGIDGLSVLVREGLDAAQNRLHATR